jgi:hypothetical protein
LDLAGWRDNLVVAVAGGIAGAAVYAGAANWLRVPELSEALGLLRRRMGRDETDAA